MKYYKIYILITIQVAVIASFLLFNSWMSSQMFTGINHFPINEVDMRVYANNKNPLTLTISLTSLNDHHHIEFLKAEILDNNNTVAEYQGRLIGGIYQQKEIEPICELPPGSEKTIRLNFNSTLSKGKYSLILYSQHMGMYPLLNSDFIVYENLNEIYY